MEREQEFKQAAEAALATVCWRDEQGYYYTEIYADYRDNLDDLILEKICNAEDPRCRFWDWLDEAYMDCSGEYEDEVAKRVFEDEDVAEFINDDNRDEAKEILRDMFYVKLPEKHYLNQEVLVDILVDTGDANYDYTVTFIKIRVSPYFQA